MRRFTAFANIDWILFSATIPLLAAGLVTMNSFGVGGPNFFLRQLIWISVSLIIFFICSTVDFRFLRKTWVSVSLFCASAGVLTLLFVVGHVSRGAASWFNLGAFSLQPSDPIKLVVIIILAKYFSRRHIEIANIRHIIVSGAYAFTVFFLVIIQPALGSAIIIFLIYCFFKTLR